MAASKAFAFLWQHGKAGHKEKDLQNDINFIIKGTYNDEIVGHRKISTRSTNALGFVKAPKAAVSFQPPPPTFPEVKFYSFWNQMGEMDVCTQFLEALLKRLNELDREALEGEEFSMIKVARRSWAFGLVYHSDDQSSDFLPGSPALERAFRLPLPKEQSFTSGWIHLWLQECALDGQCATILKGLLKCVDMIEKDPSTIVTPSHELQIMCLLFMIRTFFSLTVPDETILSRLSGVVKGLMCWTNPVGQHAIETFKAITLEQKAPGHALRHRFMLNDVRFLHKKMRGKRSTELGGKTYVVLNLTCENAGPFHSLLHRAHSNQESLEEVIDTKLLLSLLMLDEKLADKNAEAALQTAIHSWIWQLPASMVLILYDALLEVMEDASQAKHKEEALEIRQKGILEIWLDLEQAKMLGKIPELVKKRELQVEFLAKRIQPINFEVVAPEPKWRPVCTKVVEVHSQPGPMLARYSRTGAEELLMNIIANSPVDGGVKEPDPAHPVKEVVRLLLGGGDGTLHYILAGYVGLTYAGHLAGGIMASGACHSIDMLFYVLPLGQTNTLATYVAQRDLWYDATIYRPLVDRLPMIPHIGRSRENELLAPSSEDTSQPIGYPTPSKLLTRQIENYMLEANCLLKLSIFNCEGWYNDGAQHYHCTIPFLLRAEMGLPAASVCEAEDMKILHQESIPRTPLAPLDEGSLQNFMSSYSLQAEAIFRPVDWTGNEGEEKTKACSFTSIQAISVPKPSEARLGCDPCSHFLDICLMESGKVKRIKDMSDIINYVSVYRVNWLMVQAQDTSKPFDVLLDGELYGPFYRVRLSSCPHPSNRRFVLKFPVMTFWPTHVSRATC